MEKKLRKRNKYFAGKKNIPAMWQSEFALRVSRVIHSWDLVTSLYAKRILY